MANENKIVGIAVVAVIAIVALNRFSKAFNKAFNNIVPEPIRNLFGGGGIRIGPEYDRLKLVSSMTSRDNVYSTPAVSRGEITFPELLHELEAKTMAALIIEANFRVTENDTWDNIFAWGLKPTGITVDTPRLIVDVFLAAKNLSQVGQIGYWYTMASGKTLAEGIQWIPETMLAQIYARVKDMPTGAYWDATGNPLTDAEFTKLLKGGYK